MAPLCALRHNAVYKNYYTMGKYKIINNISGWAVFVVAAITYLLTIEPTASFWDCGEFIATAFKLEVGHPPGAPLFMIISRVFTLLSFGDVTKAAMMVNVMSALASAFTILFLFWSITHLARKLFRQPASELSLGQTVAIMASGAVGALAYTFSDTFWFSAVEGEVYALSSFFTAIVFWMILKWEEQANEPYANRWLVLIAYMMGLSIGVHLLNLLAIPAIVFVYYFKKYETTRRGLIVSFLLACVIMLVILYVIIPGSFKLGSMFELMFVNGFGMPYHVGLIFYSALIFGLLGWGIWTSHRKGKALLNTVLLCTTVIVIGYSSFAMIIIRSNANTPINENEPNNAFSLVHYLNREQYGDRPLFRGQYYNAPAISSEEKQTYAQLNGRYEETYLKHVYKFDPRFETVFPRMYHGYTDDHVAEYKKWANIKGKPVTVRNREGNNEVQYVPTFGENLRFFFRYQVGFMYVRYFMWNFVGRQDDVQSHGGNLHGNWVSGIKPIDALFLGNQSQLTDEAKHHPSRNVYYFMPLLLGLLGIFFQIKSNDLRNFWVVLMLFVLTGVAIVVYLNQYPLQPRERDYAYAASFYAFAIWIGLGVLALAKAVRRLLPELPSAAIAAALGLAVPVQMAAQNWDDHDRSGRYIARDFARNYLETCAPNAILFTNGDNDTFPLWYAQEVEGIRPDVLIINLSLLSTDWYCDQMKRRINDAPPAPISMGHDKYVQGTRDVIYTVEKIKERTDLKQAMGFVASDNPATRLSAQGDRRPIDFLPAKQLSLPVDRQKVLANGTVAQKDSALIVPQLEWTFNKSYFQKNTMMVLEILANNNWERPIYFVSPYGDGDVGLSHYLQLEGFAYRLVPIRHRPADILDIGRINTDILYHNLMEKFTWGRMNEPDVFIDYNVQRTAMVLRLRNTFVRLAEKLHQEGQTEKAIAVVDRIMELMPHEKFPYNFQHDYFISGIIECYYQLGETEKASALMQRYAGIMEQDLQYLFSLEPRFAAALAQEKQIGIQMLGQLLAIANHYAQADLSESLGQSYSRYVDLFQRGR